MGAEYDLSENIDEGGGSTAIADLNGDGKADLVSRLARRERRWPRCCWEMAAARFRPQATILCFFQLVRPHLLAAVAVGDLNGEGIPHIATAGGSTSSGTARAAFLSRKDYPSAAAGSVMLADFDGDGKTDIISVQATLYSFGERRLSLADRSVRIGRRRVRGSAGQQRGDS